ncbi:MAG: helix-turn-helix domain-containing protein [Thermomicrobiales bacterium]|nr:helix-turn-helix domain-containing protein [Thermomicrobiales bacterium]
MSVFGDTLRQARAQKGLTLREVERDLRINRHYLAALEEESFEHLPALTYQRGIVRSYAIYLGLDPARLVDLFLEARGVPEEEKALAPAIQQMDVPNHWAPNFAIIAFTMIAGAVIMAWLYSAYFNAGGDPPPVIGLQPTVTAVGDEVIYVPSPTPLVPTPTPTFTPSPEPTATTPPLPSSTPDAAQAAQATIQAQTAANDLTSPEQPASVPVGQAGIKITANTTIELQIAVDGKTVYSGTLAAGQSTGWATGAEFAVFTSSGINTLFTNHLGQSFTMGDEQGAVTFYLFG